MPDESFMTTGLSPEHMTELNSPIDPELRDGRYIALRQLYADNPAALEQIDIFDISSPYGEKLRDYRIALKSGDQEKIQELEAWFLEHYPLSEADY